MAITVMSQAANSPSEAALMARFHAKSARRSDLGNEDVQPKRNNALSLQFVMLLFTYFGPQPVPRQVIPYSFISRRVTKSLIRSFCASSRPPVGHSSIAYPAATSGLP